MFDPLEHLSIVRGINMADSYTNLLYHIVFSTKDRRTLITSEIEPRLYDYIGGIIRGVGGISLELWRVHGESVKRQANTSLHRETEGASRKSFISGRIHSIPESQRY